MPEPENDGTTEVVFADLVPGAQDKLKALGLITYDWQDEAGEFVPAPVQVYSPEDWQVVEAAIKTPGITKERVERARHIKAQLSSSKPARSEPAPSPTDQATQVAATEAALAKLNELMAEAQTPGFYATTEEALRSLSALETKRTALERQLERSGPSVMAGVESTELQDRIETASVERDSLFAELRAAQQDAPNSARTRALNQAYISSVAKVMDAESELLRREAMDAATSHVHKTANDAALARMQGILDENVAQWAAEVAKDPNNLEKQTGLLTAKQRALHPEQDPRYPEIETIEFISQNARLTGGSQGDAWTKATTAWAREQREHIAQDKARRLDL